MAYRRFLERFGTGESRVAGGAAMTLGELKQMVDEMLEDYPEYDKLEVMESTEYDFEPIYELKFYKDQSKYSSVKGPFIWIR